MTPSFVSTPTGAKIATYTKPGEGSVFVVGGMSGHPISASPLAEALERATARCTMMDIASSGESRHGETFTMETWLRDIEHVFERGGGGAPAIWVGSSIGAWLMLLLHRRHPTWFTAMCGLAPALDWDTEYIAPGLRSGALAVNGPLIMRDGDPIAPGPLIASMAAHHLLGTAMPLACPLHVIVGGRDDIAPADPVRRFLKATTGARCTAEFFADADHGLAKLAIPAARRRFEVWLAANGPTTSL